MAKPLAEVTSTLAKANKNEVLVVDALGNTSVIATKKEDAAFRAQLSEALAALRLGPTLHLHDWGGVIGEADKDGRCALRAETLSGADHIVFSFTPWNAKGRAELPRMADFARDAGFRGMLIMTQKEGKCGKADTFSALSHALPDQHITYYEDTYGVLRECALKEGMEALIQGGTRSLQHVLSPEFPVEDAEREGMTGLIQDGTHDGYLALWETGGSAPTGVLAERAHAAPADPSASPANASWEHLWLTDVHDLNEHMGMYSYVQGHRISEADSALLAALARAPDPAKYPHAARWYQHISHMCKTAHALGL